MNIRIQKIIQNPYLVSSANLQTEAIAKKRKIFLGILVLFSIAFFVHVTLNIFVNKAPKVFIDEGLYTNIARSLSWDGELAFRGQPVNYPYLLYPFLLVPIYWLHRFCGGDIYRFVQVFNTLLVTSSVIPAFFFAYDFTKNKRKAFATAILVALMPDMLMGGYEMTECLIWPLSLWMIFFCYRYYVEQRLLYAMISALFTGLMFACKPGAIAMGMVLLTINLLLSIARKQKVIRPLLSLLFTILIIGVVYVIFLLLFDGQDSILGLYEKQTSGWKPTDIWVALEAFFLTIFLFVFACCGIFALYPYTHLKEYEPIKRTFMISVAIGVLVTIMGTAIFVVPYQWTGKLGNLPLHLRYCSMFIPLMYVFTVDPESPKRKNSVYISSLFAFIFLSLFPGARAGFVPDRTMSIDSVVLNAFASTRNMNGKTTGWLITIFVVIFTSVVLVYLLINKPILKNSKISLSITETLFFTLFILTNAVCAYINANIYIDPTISTDANEVNRIVGSERYLGIMQRRYDDIYSYWLDGRLNVPMQQVTIDQMIVQMNETDGIYSPFIPDWQAPNVNNHLTPDTNKFVLGMTIANHLELSENVTNVKKTANGHFTLIEITPSKRWVDTMMYGLDDNMLSPGVNGYIQIYDNNRNLDGFLHLTISASGSGYLSLGDEKISLTEQEQTYECTLPFSNLIPLSAEGSTVNIYSYSTQSR